MAMAVAQAQALLRRVGLGHLAVSRTSDCSPALLTELIKRLFNVDFDEGMEDMRAAASCQRALNYLADEVLHFDLSHILGDELARGDAAAIHNILEILHSVAFHPSEPEMAEESWCEEGGVNNSSLLPLPEWQAGSPSTATLLESKFVGATSSQQPATATTTTTAAAAVAASSDKHAGVTFAAPTTILTDEDIERAKKSCHDDRQGRICGVAGTVEEDVRLRQLPGHQRDDHHNIGLSYVDARSSRLGESKDSSGCGCPCKVNNMYLSTTVFRKLGSHTKNSDNPVVAAAANTNGNRVSSATDDITTIRNTTDSTKSSRSNVNTGSGIQTTKPLLSASQQPHDLSGITQSRSESECEDTIRGRSGGRGGGGSGGRDGSRDENHESDSFEEDIPTLSPGDLQRTLNSNSAARDLILRRVLNSIAQDSGHAKENMKNPSAVPSRRHRSARSNAQKPPNEAKAKFKEEKKKLDAAVKSLTACLADSATAAAEQEQQLSNFNTKELHELQLARSVLESEKRRANTVLNRQAQQAARSKQRADKEEADRTRKIFDRIQSEQVSSQRQARTNEDASTTRVFKNTLACYREQTREISRFAREQQAKQAERKANTLTSLERWYHDQVAVLDERLREQQTTQSQKAEMEQMRRDLQRRFASRMAQLQG